jgi:hypothetical protein
MERGDTVKFVVDMLRIIAIVEEEALVTASPVDLTVDATRQGVTQRTRFKFPIDYLTELGVQSENDLIELENCRYFVSSINGEDILLQDTYNHYYIKAKAFQLIY